MIPQKESSSSDDSYDDEVGDDTVVNDDTTNTNFEIELPTISSSPNQDTSPMHFSSVEKSSVTDNISSNPPAAKPHIDVVPAVTPIQPSPSIVENKLGKQRVLRTRGGKRNNFSTRSVPVTRQVPAIPSRSKSNRKRHHTTSDS